MKKFLLVINTILIIVVIGFTGLITLGFLIGDKSDYGMWIFVLVFSGLILFPLLVWRKKLNQSKNPNMNISPNVQEERPQNVITEQPLKNETVELIKSVESKSDSPIPTEPTTKESESEDKDKVLYDFIELCLLGGELTDKKKEVVLRKSNELGIPEDECEIMIDSILYKMNNQDES